MVLAMLDPFPRHASRLRAIEVLGIDIDRLKVDCINRGASAVVEPGLAELINSGVAAGRLRATTDADRGRRRVDGLRRYAEQRKRQPVPRLCCAGGGSDRRLPQERRAPTMSSASAARFFREPSRVLSFLFWSSTREGRPGSDFGVCMNPEFLREGSSIADFHCAAVARSSANSTLAAATSSKRSTRASPRPVIRTKLASQRW